MPSEGKIGRLGHRRLGALEVEGRRDRGLGVGGVVDVLHVEVEPRGTTRRTIQLLVDAQVELVERRRATLLVALDVALVAVAVGVVPAGLTWSAGRRR
jgi:hypothetical protein